ncbi:MAG: AI-2E family transporter [Betaproteobacteria bacterium]|nr:AI-2E family transporter [Betaproteobacteria bacterium]
MSVPPTPSEGDRQFINRTVEAAIRIGVLAALAVWCFDIARPFLVPLVWGVIIAVATYPAYRGLEARLGERRILAAVLFTILMIVVVAVPSAMLGDSMASGAREAARAFQAGSLEIPPPPERVKSWPFVGESLYSFWQLASENIVEAARELSPWLKTSGKWLLGAAAGAGIAALQFLLAIIIAGALLAHAEGGGRAMRTIAQRLAPERGLSYSEVAEQTVRSVALGILGVALLQGLLAGIGFLVAGVPGAGLLTLVCIVLGVIQVGVAIVLIPVVIYLFSTAETFTAVAFLVYAILVAPLDNILKPILLGRGVKVPMVVVFIGAIGGFINAGIVGLFIGAVVFTLGYGLFLAWLNPEPQPAAPESK